MGVARVLCLQSHACFPLSSSPLLFSAVAAFGTGTSVTVTCTQAALAGGNPVTVTLTVTKDGCSASASMEYTLKATPTVTAPADDSKCVEADDTSNIIITNWTATEGSTLTVTPAGCTAGEGNHIANDTYCHGRSAKECRESVYWNPVGLGRV